MSASIEQLITKTYDPEVGKFGELIRAAIVEGYKLGVADTCDDMVEMAKACTNESTSLLVAVIDLTIASKFGLTHNAETRIATRIVSLDPDDPSNGNVDGVGEPEKG